MRNNIIASLAAFLILSQLSCNKQPEISQFRGPDRSGIYYDTELLKEWPPEGPQEVFRVDSVGDGYGSPVIADDLMYFTAELDSMAVLYCYNLNGIEEWKLQLGKEWVKNYPGSRSSPTIIGNLIYVETGKGNLYCVDKKNQSIQWQKSITKDFQGVIPLFGHSESPCVYDDKVFWTVGGDKFNVVAINRFSGNLIWSSKGKGERSAYHHPSVISLPTGRHILITFSAYHLMGFDVNTGELLWSHEQDNYPVSERKPGYGDTHANTVIYKKNNIYYIAGDGNCAVKLAIADDGSSIQEVWRNKQFDSYMGGVVMLDNYLYGSGTAKPFLLSLNADSGELADSLKLGRGVIISADSMIYYYSQTGKIHLVSCDQGKLKEISNFRIKGGTGEHFSHPIIFNKKLYIRRGNIILGYEI